MRSNFLILLLSYIIVTAAHAQEEQPPSLNIGDPAPPLRVKQWLKGEPVSEYQKGRVYIIEFWATWCAPCRAAMPHLSELARKYKDRVTIIGVDVKEKKTTTLQTVGNFVDAMGLQMDYVVAVEDSNFMETNWLDASEGQWKYGIPRSFVVNAEGKLAWVGHPGKLDKVLSEIVNNTWDINKALTKQKLDIHLAALDDSLNWELMKYRGDRYNPDDPGKPDSALIMIDKIIVKEPGLKYAPFMASTIFSNLLKTNLHKAYEYGKTAIVTSTYVDPPYDAIYGGIEFYRGKLKLPTKFYQLGAEAYKAEISDIVYPELVDMAKCYSILAEWYWRANNKSSAINAQSKAIEELKKRKGSYKEDLSLYEARLKRYKTSNRLGEPDKKK